MPLEFYINLTVNEFIPTKDLTETTPFVSKIARWMAKWKAVIVVSFLWIVIRANFIYPKGNRVILLILVI